MSTNSLPKDWNSDLKIKPRWYFNDWEPILGTVLSNIYQDYDSIIIISFKNLKTNRKISKESDFKEYLVQVAEEGQDIYKAIETSLK